MPTARFDPNAPALKANNIFGLPFNEEDSRLIILPVPWEVTVSFNSGTARGPEHILTASRQIDVLDLETDDAWKQGIYMPHPDKNLLVRSDYLRKEAELCINFLEEGGKLEENEYLLKARQEVNEGCRKMNGWVYQRARDIMQSGKLVVLLGGDHSTSLGLLRAVGDQFGDFGILQIDAHCDLRNGYQGFHFSHASIMYNALEGISQVKKLVQLGVRDCCQQEVELINAGKDRISVYFDRRIKERQFDGETWKDICSEIVSQLPAQVHISFDIDGLDPKLCPHTGTPVPGGFETEEIFYLLNAIVKSGRKLLSFDLVEIAYAQDDWDVNVGARILFRLCCMLIRSNA